MTEPIEITQFDEITAVFSPQRTDDLTRLARRMIGHRLKWRVAWLIEEGEYAGQWAVINELWNIGWVPICDLSEIEYD